MPKTLLILFADVLLLSQYTEILPLTSNSRIPSVEQEWRAVRLQSPVTLEPPASTSLEQTHGVADVEGGD